MEKQGVKTRDLVEMALFAAIIVILAFTPLGYIPLGVITPTTVHIPVIIAGIILGLLVLIFGFESKYILLLGLGLFFIAFNVMEALLPSWLSKAAPIQSKATAMGVNASSQFLGAFFGGMIGGQLLMLNHTAMGWSILTAIAIIWLLVSFGLAQPRYLDVDGGGAVR